MSNPSETRAVTDDFIRGMFYAHKLARGEAAAHRHGGNVEGAAGAEAVADKISRYIDKQKAQQAEGGEGVALYLSEPMARVVLEMYDASYSEGLTPESFPPLLDWIVEHYPHLFEERAFSHLPREW